MAPLPAPAEKPSHRVSDSQSHAKVRPPTQVAVFCAALWPNLQPALTGVGVLRLNLVSFQIYFQCKRWKGSVGAKEIREFRGALQGGADKGLFITTGHFTSQASEEATRAGAIAIDLIDGDRLCDLLKDNRLGVETEMIERVRIRSDWFKGI